MALTTGSYKISSATGLVAGRKSAEDRSGHPKGIYCGYGVSDSVTVSSSRSGTFPPLLFLMDVDWQWDVKHIGGGRYTLSTRGTTVVEINGWLFAVFSLNGRKDTARSEWTITSHPQHGGLCTIKNASGAGWVAPRGDIYNNQITVSPLAAARSLPPKYFQSGLWSFTPDIGRPGETYPARHEL